MINLACPQSAYEQNRWAYWDVCCRRSLECRICGLVRFEYVLSPNFDVLLGIVMGLIFIDNWNPIYCSFGVFNFSQILTILICFFTLCFLDSVYKAKFAAKPVTLRMNGYPTIPFTFPTCRNQPLSTEHMIWCHSRNTIPGDSEMTKVFESYLQKIPLISTNHKK